MENNWSKRSSGFMQDLLKATEFELQNALFQSKKAETEVATPERELIDTNSNIKVSIGEKSKSIECKKINQRQINKDDSSEGSVFSKTKNLFTKCNESVSESLEMGNLEKQIYSKNVTDVLKAFPHTSKKQIIDDTIKAKCIEDTKLYKIEHLKNGKSEDGHTIETGEIGESDDDFENLTLTQSPFFLILDIPGITSEGEDDVNELSRHEESEDTVENNIVDSSFLYNEKEAEEPPDNIHYREDKSLSTSFIGEFSEYSNEVLTYSKKYTAFEGTLSVNAESELFSDIKKSPESISNNFKSEDLLDISCIETLKHQFSFNELVLKCYECHICLEEFKYSKILLQHIECHGIDKYQCTVCEYCSIDVLEFYRHRAVHTNTKPFTCNLCNYESVLMEELTEHVLLHYETTYECNMCYFTSGLKEQLDEHIKTHDKEINLEEHRLLIDDSLQFQEHILWQFSHSPYKVVSQFSGYLKNDASNHMSHPLAISSQAPNVIIPENKSVKLTPKMSISQNMSRPCTQGSSLDILNCDVCDYKCTKKTHLDMHMIMHSGDRQYKCTLCDYSCRQNQNLNRHMQIHRDEKALNYTECEYQSDKKYNLQRHMVTHVTEESNKYKKCNNSFDHEGDLKKLSILQNNSTRNEYLYRCKECSLVYNSDIDFIMHRINHSKSRLFICEECDYKSNKKNDIVKHVKRHFNQLICKGNDENLQTVGFDNHKKYQECNSSGYKCSNCEYITYKKTELVTHTLMHKSEKPHKCNECKFAFHRSGDLKRHIMTHTGEKPFKCLHCNYTCSRSYQLGQHMKLQHNAKLYTCSKCECNCNSVRDLNKHQITCNKKPFKCHHCNYASNKKMYLNRHLKEHTKSFKCNLCDYGGTNNYELKSHMYKMHPRKVSNSHVRKYSNAKNCKSLKKKHKQK